MGFLKNPGIRRQGVFLAPFSENCSERQVCFLAQLILPSEISPVQTFTPHLLSEPGVFTCGDASAVPSFPDY